MEKGVMQYDKLKIYLDYAIMMWLIQVKHHYAQMLYIRNNVLSNVIMGEKTSNFNFQFFMKMWKNEIGRSVNQ